MSRYKNPEVIDTEAVQEAGLDLQSRLPVGARPESAVEVEAFLTQTYIDGALRMQDIIANGAEGAAIAAFKELGSLLKAKDRIEQARKIRQLHSPRGKTASATEVEALANLMKEYNPEQVAEAVQKATAARKELADALRQGPDVKSLEKL